MGIAREIALGQCEQTNRRMNGGFWIPTEEKMHELINKELQEAGSNYSKLKTRSLSHIADFVISTARTEGKINILDGSNVRDSSNPPPSPVKRNRIFPSKNRISSDETSVQNYLSPRSPGDSLGQREFDDLLAASSAYRTANLESCDMNEDKLLRFRGSFNRKPSMSIHQ